MALAKRLKTLLLTISNKNPDIHLEFDMPLPIDSINETISINLYRIVQEAVNNALKYAQANLIKVSLHEQTIKKHDLIVLIIEDDGVGMDIEAVDQSKHFGLLGMRERVQGLEGTFSLRSNEPDGKQGTRIQIMIPKNQE